jgi:uncharacterized DUF497 family protein
MLNMTDIFDQFTGFQWDEGNINKNLYKHNIENWECEQVFFNEPLIILDDPKHSYAEKRWAAFGKTDAGKLLSVVFTKRGSLIRIISARSMKRKERNFYAKYQ